MPICKQAPAMNEDIVSVPSAGLRLHGALGTPAGLPPAERRAAFLVLHGFSGNRESAGVIAPTRVLSELGYVTLLEGIAKAHSIKLPALLSAPVD